MTVNKFYLSFLKKGEILWKQYLCCKLFPPDEKRNVFFFFLVFLVLRFFLMGKRRVAIRDWEH